MPEKEPFFIPLGLDDELRVRITTQGPHVTHFTVQQETRIDGRMIPVVRYDTAHGQAHIDVLDGRGRTIQKIDLGFFFPYNQALQWCLTDAKRRWESRKDAFPKGMDT